MCRGACVPEYKVGLVHRVLAMIGTQSIDVYELLFSLSDIVFSYLRPPNYPFMSCAVYLSLSYPAIYLPSNALSHRASHRSLNPR